MDVYRELTNFVDIIFNDCKIVRIKFAMLMYLSTNSVPSMLATLQIRKLQLQSVESCAQCHLASEWQDQDADPGLLKSKPTLLICAISPSYFRLILTSLVVDCLPCA